MVTSEFLIKNRTGLHAKPAAELTKTASRFKDVTASITYQGNEVNLKSVLGVLSLGIGYNSKIVISVSGADEQKALHVIQSKLLDLQLI